MMHPHKLMPVRTVSCYYTYREAIETGQRTYRCGARNSKPRLGSMFKVDKDSRVGHRFQSQAQGRDEVTSHASICEALD